MKKNLIVYCIENDSDDLLRQWHPTLNGSLTPDAVPCGSQKKVWWRCEAGHEWQTRVSSRTKIHSSCPFCSGRRLSPGKNDLASQNPELIAQWHPLKNGSLTPETITCANDKKVWWICDKGHEWQTAVINRTRKDRKHTGCPYCAGRKVLKGFNDLATKEPELAAQWHPTKNDGLTPDQVTPGMKKKVWWLCEKGHEWNALIQSRNAGCGCPECARKKEW